MIFDIKLDFTQKARFVAGGRTTSAPTSMTYSSVVARDSVRLVLLHAALNDIDLLAADIGNAYLYTQCRERIWTIAGTEFDELWGSVLIIEKALYGLKSSGAAWRAILRQIVLEMEFCDTTADHYVYRRVATKPKYITRLFVFTPYPTIRRTLFLRSSKYVCDTEYSGRRYLYQQQEGRCHLVQHVIKLVLPNHVQLPMSRL